MNRIAIIGCGGSGKSYLARQLGAVLGVPVTHLDALYYDRHWNPIPARQFARLQRDLVTQPRWIIDGNYASTMAIRLAETDTVIFLDLPAGACLWGILQRRLRHAGGQHAALGVYNRITWQFLRYVLGHRRSMRPRVRQLLAEYARHADLVVLGSRQAVRHYLATIKAPTRNTLAALDRRVTTIQEDHVAKHPERPAPRHLATRPPAPWCKSVIPCAGGSSTGLVSDGGSLVAMAGGSRSRRWAWRLVGVRSHLRSIAGMQPDRPAGAGAQWAGLHTVGLVQTRE